MADVAPLRGETEGQQPDAPTPMPFGITTQLLKAHIKKSTGAPIVNND